MAAISWTIHTFDQLNSTQSYAREMLGDGASEGMLIQTSSQVNGYGRHQRSWVGGTGNLLLSFIITPECSHQSIFQFSFMTSLALHDALVHLAPDLKSQLRLKWPNDLLLKDRKCAGILIETDQEASGRLALIIGLGVNLSSAPEEGVALIDVLPGNKLVLDDVRDRFLEQFQNLYAQWHSGGWGEMRSQWLEKSYAIGQRLRVKVQDSPCEGAFHGLSKDGSLELKLNDGSIKTISSGDVFVE